MNGVGARKPSIATENRFKAGSSVQNQPHLTAMLNGHDGANYQSHQTGLQPKQVRGINRYAEVSLNIRF